MKHNDQGWNLAGALLCFIAAYILSLKGCDPSLVAMVAGGGVSAVGAIGGMSRGSTSTTATTSGNPPITEVKTDS